MINLIHFIAIFFLTIMFCYFYIFVWNKTNLKIKTPSGFGFLLIFFLTVNSIYNGDDTIIFYSLLFFGAIYWLDDLLSLSANSRFFIQFITGVLIGIFIVNIHELNFNPYFIIIILISGIINLILTNVTNFYDGLDLNLSTLLIIFSLSNLHFLSNNLDLFNQSVLIISFVLGFSFFNYRKDNIFFGDSGCFIIASFMNYHIINYLIVLDFSLFYLLTAFALPLFDVLYVLYLRIKLRENLFTRNYHHLYHKIYYYSKNKLYILNQIANFLLIIFIYEFLKSMNLSETYSIILSAICVTPLYYSIIRFIVSRENEY